MTEFVCVLKAGAGLGEGPCWDTKEQCLWWVDIYAKEIHRFDTRTGADTVLAVPAAPGSIAVRQNGGLIAAMGDGFAFVDPASGAVEQLATPELDMPATRMNDGRTDRQGRFWAGSMCDLPNEPAKPIGSLYRVGVDQSCTRMISGVGISNGLAWSPDGRTMYHADSITPFVWKWDYDVSTGDIANREVFIDLSEIEGIADGATVDAEGCYWVALPFKGAVRRYDPAGKLVQSIALPVEAPTCCEFGGPNLDILYVTSATFGAGPAQLAHQPLAGGLFALDAGVRGVAPSPYLG